MGTTTQPALKISEGTKRFAERIYAAAHEGKLPSEVMEEERKRTEEERKRTEEERKRTEEELKHVEQELKRAQEEAARQLEAERQRAEEAAHQLEAERQRAEEAAHQLEAERQRITEETILRMSKQLAMSTAQIAVALDVPVEVIEEVLLRHLEA